VPRSPLALYLLLGYTLLILYASLSPFTGWRHPGVGILSFLTEPLPRFISPFDVAVNVLAYVPVGFLATLVLPPVCRAPVAMIAGALTGVGLSFAMEVAQGFLPARISNNVDLLANSGGAIAGALACPRTGTLSVFTEHLARWRGRWFLPGGLMDLGLALIALWLFSQLDPSLPLFGVVFFSAGVQAQLAGLAANATSKLLGPLSVALNLVAVGLTLMLIMRSSRAALGAVALLVWIAALIKLVAATVLLRSEAAFLWVSREIALAIAVGALGIVVASTMSRRAVQAACALALVGAIALSLVKPGGTVSFLSLRLFRWTYAQLLHYTGLAAAVSEFWPYAALVFLFLLWRHDRKQADDVGRVQVPS
jgi:VanZ family protein